MAYIKNTDTLVEGSSQLFFTEQRAQDAVAADLQALDAAITAEESRAQAAESALDGRLDVVEGSGEGSILKAKQDAQAYADQKVADLVNSAPAVLDTLKELSDALGGDENFAVTVSNQIGAVDGKVDQEISDRQAAVSAEQGRAQAAEQALDGRLDVIEGSGEGSVAKAEQDAKDYADGIVSSEQSARMAADTNLSNRISALEVDPVSKTYVDTAVSSEQSAREAADQALDARLDILEQDETTKAYVDQQVSAEQSRAEAAEGLLSGRLDVVEGMGEGSVAKAEQDAKDYADSKIGDLEGQPDVATFVGQLSSSVFSAISAEQSRAEGEEALLSGRLDVLEQDPTTKAYVDGQISSEQSARESADSLLDGRLDALELDPVSKTYVDGEVSDLQGQITQEVSDRQSAVSAEQSARQSADSALSGRLNVLEADPVTKAYVDSEVSAEQSRAEAAESALDGRLDALELDPVSKSYVDSQDGGLQSQINTEKGRIDAILSASSADKDSFAEIVSLINSVDAANDSAFAGYVLSNDAALAQEISDRQAGDSALDLRLDALELDPVTKSYVDGLNSSMDARVDALELDPVSKTYVDGADATLQSNIDGLFASKSTSDLAEGSRLYYTQARFDSAFGAKSTSNLSEGTNLYFTDARAKSASIVNSSSGSQTDQAMSVSSAKSYIDAADALMLKLDGSTNMTGALKIVAGTVSAPGVSFVGATSNGMYYNGSDTVGISVGGASRLTVTSAGISSVTGTFQNSVSSATVNLTGASNSHLRWNTDGAGDIGATAANRPNNLYVKTDAFIGSRVIANQSGATQPVFTFTGATNYGLFYNTSQVGITVNGSASITCSQTANIMNKVLAVSAGMGLSRTAVAANLTMAGSETLMGVTSTAAPRIITLPSAVSFSGRTYFVKDESGAASATNYIRVQPGTAGQTLDGAAYYDIKVPYEGLIVYSNGTNWFII